MEADTHHFEAFTRWLTLRNYAEPTKKSYQSRLRRFLIWRHRNGYAEEITQDQARDFLAYRSEQGLSWQSINGDYSCLRLFFTKVLEHDWSVDHLPRPRKEKALPTVLSVEEVGRLINAGTMLKHQAFMALLYGTGLRLSEALHLKYQSAPPRPAHDWSDPRHPGLPDAGAGWPPPGMSGPRRSPDIPTARSVRGISAKTGTSASKRAC